MSGIKADSYIPEAEIEDYPEMAYRGVMVDFSHGGLLTEQEIMNQIDFLSRWKMNQYYFYNEVSIEMKGYPLINYNACYSQEQIRRIVAYARKKHMDVIPFVNSTDIFMNSSDLKNMPDWASENTDMILIPEIREYRSSLRTG